MDERTLAALKESIAKWEKRAAGEHDGKLGPIHCPLCRLYHIDHRTDDEASCTGCPISEKCGDDYCAGTPYCAYADADEDEVLTFHAKAELDFLKSLLPVEESEVKPSAFAWTDLKYLR